MRTFLKSTLAAALTALLVTGGACLSDGGERAFPDVVLEGQATDAALGTVIDMKPTASAALAPIITSPPDNSVLAPAPIITFTWEPGGTTAALPAFLPSPAPRPAAPALPAWLGELLGPERAAHAAPAPVSGMGYLLVFATIKQPELLRVFTTKTSYTPDDKAWKVLRSAGMWTGLTVISAAFVNDARVPGPGPFASEPVDFCIEPE